MAALVERGEQLATLLELFEQAVQGHGHLVFVAAEAGAGKSTLVQAFSDSVADRARILTGWCEPLSTPRPAGPLIDMASALGPAVTSILREHDRAGLFDATFAALSIPSERPSVLVFEDVHWADETTLDMLRFLGRRVGAVAALIIATYRDDETGPAHPLRTRLGDLATQPDVARLNLAPLSLEAVTTLAADSTMDPRDLWSRTGGNAFYVTEVLAAASDASTSVPGTVADAVIARGARLSAAARYALVVAAVAGSRAAPSVLLEVTGVDGAAVDECAEAGFLRLTPPVLTFAHELVRQAVLTTIGAAQRQDLAAQVLSAWRRQSRLDGSSAPLARLAELAEEADDRARVLEYAPAAAREAAELGSHREAAAQYVRVLRFVDEPSPDLLEPLSVEQYLTGDLLGAIRSREQALIGRRAERNLLAMGDDLRWLSRLHWYAGHAAEAERAEAESLSVLSALGPSPELAMALSTRSQYLMLRGANADAVSWGNRAIELATELELPDVLSHANNNVGTSRMSMGERAGLDQLRESLRLALQINAEDHAARAYVNLAYHLISIRELDEAVAVLEDGLAYCQGRDLGLQSPYLRASRALVHTYAGRWDEADTEAGRLLAGPSGSPIHRFVALLPVAAVRMRTGASPVEVNGWLDELGRLARQLGEGQRLVPYAILRAEAAWLTGTDISGDAELLEIYAKERAGSSWVELTELTFWLHRAGLALEAPPVAAGPLHDWLLDPEATADRLLALGCGYEAAMCLLGGSEAAVRRALQIFVDLGAQPAVALAQAELRARGVRRIPRGPRAPTRNHPFGLTARQHEVLELIGERLSNAEIAARLVLSERTVGHHVSAILAKLEVTTRDQAAHRLSALRP